MSKPLDGVLTIVSGSGGVGRSTLALNMGAEQVREGARVLLVDLDPRGGLSLMAGVGTAANEAGVVGALNRPDHPLAFVVQTDYPGLAVLPAGPPANRGALRGLASNAETMVQLVSRLREWFHSVILDVPSGTGPVVQAALSASDIALACVVPEPLPVRLLPDVLETIASTRGHDGPVAFAGICLNRANVEAPFFDHIVRELSRSFPELVLETVLPEDPWFIEAAARALPLPFLMPEASGSMAVFRLIEEVRDRLLG